MTDHQLTLFTLAMIAKRVRHVADKLPPLLAAEHVEELIDISDTLTHLRQLLKGETNASAISR